MPNRDGIHVESFNRGVVAHIGLVRHIGAATLSGQDDLDDFTQDVLARVFANRDQLRDMSRLRAWIASVARNTARNWNRQQQLMFTELSGALELPALSADERLSERERWSALVDALSHLPKSDQSLIRAYYVDELSSREIQAQTQLSSGAIRVRLSRARAVLRERLAPLLAVLGVLDTVRTPRRFGEVPKGSNRMGMTGSLACSLAVAGWLGFGAVQVEEAVWNATAFAPQGVTLAQIELLAPEFRPTVELARTGGGAEGTGRQITPPPTEEKQMSKVLDIVPVNNVSTIVGSLHAMLQGAGQSQWSHARLQGVLGHAFSFEMREGAGEVWQEANLDWGGFLAMLPDLGYRIRRYEAAQRDEEGDFKELKAEAWHAVRASVDRGIPAVAWIPMSREQKADGLGAWGWGLLVGYDDSDETYAVRSQYVDGGRKAFTVPYDAIGHNDDAEIFHVLVYDEPAPVDATDSHIRALRLAVAFANGTRFDPEDNLYSVDASGHAAYELWRQAIKSGVAAAGHSQYHAVRLRVFRRHAAAYLRELVDLLPSAAADLREAAGHYDQLVKTAATLHDLCAEAKDAGGFWDDARSEAAGLITAALDADRAAIASIEAALAVLHESR